jgi:hypothetical protein
LLQPYSSYGYGPSVDIESVTGRIWPDINLIQKANLSLLESQFIHSSDLIPIGRERGGLVPEKGWNLILPQITIDTSIRIRMGMENGNVYLLHA